MLNTIKTTNTPHELLELRARLFGSLLLFTQTFYKLRTGRDFVLSNPIGREAHQITICRELKKVFNLETNRLMINIPPGHGKSELLIHFVAWAMAHYPDSAFLYISYSQELAAKHTYTIKQIIEMPYYKKIFSVEIKSDSSAKDNFRTTHGGVVKAFGSAGSITGQDAGLPNLDRFSGAAIMDDMHKPDEVHSDVTRERVKTTYHETIIPRPRSENVPIIFLGHRLHEDDLPGNLIEGMDGFKWKQVKLPAIDVVGNVLAPNLVSKERLLIYKEKSPYLFHSQYQQEPQPAGGGIFKSDGFHLTDEEPEILVTFITCDTAETDKDYNDATVFSFWGLYRLKQFDVDIGMYGLHWIDCRQIRVEPKDLENEFKDFYRTCCFYKIKPKLAAIEKKSTGVTLLSTLKGMQGIEIMDIKRDATSKSKTQRFLSIQPYVAGRYISLPKYSNHTSMCIQHCEKITANNTHAFDDIADTLYDAIKIALIDKVIPLQINAEKISDVTAKNMMSRSNYVNQLRKKAYGYRSR